MVDICFVVVGWITKLIVAFAILGVIGYDGVTLVAAHLGATDDADNAASAASNNYFNNKSPSAALVAAEESLPGSEHIVPHSLKISPTGAVTLSISRDTKTLIAHDLGFLKHECDFDTTGTAPASTG